MNHRRPLSWEGCPLDQGLNGRFTTNLIVGLGSSYHLQARVGEEKMERQGPVGVGCSLLLSHLLLLQDPGLGELRYWGQGALTRGMFLLCGPGDCFFTLIEIANSCMGLTVCQAFFVTSWSEPSCPHPNEISP